MIPSIQKKIAMSVTIGRARCACVLVLVVAGIASADDSSEFQNLLEKHQYSVELGDGKISGPGADLILKAAAKTQFVALGEEHYNHVIPDTTTALFRELHAQFDFQYFMTEQDPVMMELFSRDPNRGDLTRISALAQTYPMGVTFNSDEEIRMLADIGGISTASDDPI